MKSSPFWVQINHVCHDKHTTMFANKNNYVNKYNQLQGTMFANWQTYQNHMANIPISPVFMRDYDLSTYPK